MSDEKKKSYSASEICREAGISKNTLLRWESEEKIPKAKKDWRGWRVFTEDDLQKVLKYKEEKALKNQ